MIVGIESPGKDTSVSHTDTPSSRNCTAPSTPDDLSPAMAASRQNGYTLKQEEPGSSKADPSSNGKGAALKNGKSNTKAAPLPPGFLESELQSHKRKLKVAEHAIDVQRQEIAALKRQMAAATAESQELRVAKAALETACTAANEAQQQSGQGMHQTAGQFQWMFMGISVLSVSAVVAIVASRSTALQNQWHPSR